MQSKKIGIWKTYMQVKYELHRKSKYTILKVWNVYDESSRLPRRFSILLLFEEALDCFNANVSRDENQLTTETQFKINFRDTSKDNSGAKKITGLPGFIIDYPYSRTL